jgi:hypothetical protein
MYVRDAESRTDTHLDALGERLERVHHLDDYDVTNLYTAGIRGAGKWNAVDWELETAYQWGNADAVGALFVPNGRVNGDNRAQWDYWAGHAALGYTFEFRYKPRLAVGGAFYQGEDNRGFSGKLLNDPFARPDASVSFNRLFSSWREDEFIDAFAAVTNFWKAYVEATVHCAEALELGLNVACLQAFAPFDYPPYCPTGSWGTGRVSIAPDKPWWTKEGSTDLGWQATLTAVYQYSKDLTFEVGWSHYFVGQAIQDGVFIDGNGLTFGGGRDKADADLVYFLTTLEF